MLKDYSIEVYRQLEQEFRSANLRRPMQIERYEPGTVLDYAITGVAPAHTAQVRVEIEKFIGGGFAGQVYRVKVIEVFTPQGPITGVEEGAVLAMKILVPPGRFAELFRNTIYGIGFQGPFQLQVNPAAARAGALWQKFIRRAAKIHFGDERSVVDIYATFVDNAIGSCGELSEWLEGRTWRLEVDDRLDLLKRWRRGKPVDPKLLGSPEYRTKRKFMAEFVKLLHQMGAPEFARQYEWSTCKSQPNCLKRWDSEGDPTKGLAAVDFRAGLALLPFLPMSPGDFKLIGKGLARGRLVQFDRGSLKQLKQYIDAHPEVFADMQPAFEELQQVEDVYRNSTPDITHNHIRLLTSGKLWSTMFQSTITSWRTRNLINENCARRLSRSKILSTLFFLLGLIGALGSTAVIAGVLAGLWTVFTLIRGKNIPFSTLYFALIAFVGGLVISPLCQFLRRIWGRADYRRHYLLIFLSWDYLKRAVQAKVAEKLIGWYRAGRIGDAKALYLVNHPMRFFLEMPLGFLPAGLHRFITDGQFAKEKLSFIFVRPVRLYFDAALREQWLRDMVAEGRKNHTLTDEDAGVILDQLHEPYIQKYLKSLAVHVCTLPVTQVVAVIIALVYWAKHPELTWKQASAYGGIILGLLQVVPISPGSICRGVYVVYLVIRERNFKDYNIAVFLGFFKYVGYLAFPIQMANRYPVLARFMAAHWATGAVHVVPVFGEQGALLEHGIFGIFYNLPLTIRRRMQARAQKRAAQKARYLHGVLCALAAAVILILFDGRYVESISDSFQAKDILKETWWLVLGLPLAAGAAVTLGAGGASLARRIVQAALCGLTTGLFYIVIYAGLKGWQNVGTLAAIPVITPTAVVAELLIWRVFTFCIFSVIAVLLTELSLPETQTGDHLDKNEVVAGKMVQ